MNLSTLSPQQKATLHSLLVQEAQRRKVALRPKNNQGVVEELRPYPDSPQERAYNCRADIVGYGGEGGGGKSFLALLLAATKHHRSTIYRRVSPSLEGIVQDSLDHFPARPDWRFVASPIPTWRFDDGRSLRFKSMQHETDMEKARGNPADFIVFEEATEFTEMQVRFRMGWNRSTVIDPRTKKPYFCQMLMTFNPPQTVEGQWVIKFFAPWVDPTHHNPAADGELRYFAMIDGIETEVEDGSPFAHNGETIKPKSRTFFHASLKDNPILAETGYGSTIDSLPEPMRSLLKGNFNIAHVDHIYQVIPSTWIDAAMVRWVQTKRPTIPITAIGVDVARGGKDATVIAPRYGTWFDAVELHPGISTTDGTIVADYVMPYAVRGASVILDVIGVGTSPYDVCVKRGYAIYGFNGGSGAPPPGTDTTGKLQMLNLRAYAYWRLREALDPVNGDNICLPPDPELKADLCSARWQMTPLRLKIESKDDIKKRIGRSPDKGDALIMAAFIPTQTSISVGNGTAPTVPVDTTATFLKRLHLGTTV